MRFYALHGFLGLPSDWDFLSDLRPVTPSIYDNITSYEEWALQFNASIDPKEENILLGYSLGGRLALHALVAQPNLWKKAIIVSAHTGISEDSKQQKLLQDEGWANRFESELWDSLIEDWNQQATFCGVPSPFVRLECQFQRKKLANLLRHFSLGRQKDLSSKIAKLDVPILWIAGERDLRYKQLANCQHLSHPHSLKWIAPDSGHRVPWESAEAFRDQVKKFLGERQWS